MALDRENPPLCPSCGKMPWRTGHLASLLTRDPVQDGEFCVCMYCSSIWRLEGTAWRAVSAEELAHVGPSLEAVASRFASNRRLAEELGMSVDEMIARLEAVFCEHAATARGCVMGVKGARETQRGPAYARRRQAGPAHRG